MEIKQLTPLELARMVISLCEPAMDRDHLRRQITAAFAQVGMKQLADMREKMNTATEEAWLAGYRQALEDYSLPKGDARFVVDANVTVEAAIEKVKEERNGTDSNGG